MNAHTRDGTTTEAAQPGLGCDERERCAPRSVDLSLGSLEMSPALLSQLTPGSPWNPALVVRFGAYEERDHQGWQLQFSAEAEPLNPDGTFVSSHDVTLK